MTRWQWHLLAPRIVRLVLTGPGELDMHVEGRSATLQDRDGAVRFSIERSTQDEDEVTPGPAATRAFGPPDPALAQQFDEWAAGSRCISGAALLSALPAGSYLIVRSDWPPTPAGRVHLGDGWVERGVDHELITDDEETHAILVNATPNERPALDGPLLGLFVADTTYPGRDAPPILLAGLGGGGAAEGRSGDLVLVLPTSGPLVVRESHPLAGDRERLGSASRTALAERLAGRAPEKKAATLHFEPGGDRFAELTVRRSGEGPITCSHGPWEIELGTPRLRAPALSFVRDRRKADTTWQLRRAARPVLLGEEPEPDPDVVGELLEWLEGTRLTHGLSALAALPAGSYLLIRVREAACGYTRDGLRLPGPFDGQILGVTTEPDLSQPLIGLVVEPGTPTTRVVFSPLVTEAPSAPTTSDLVLVLPLRGELVTHADEEAARDWCDDRGPALAATLARSGVMKGTAGLGRVSRTAEEFVEGWQERYPRVRPYTWELRQSDDGAWTRYYMLPHAKRGPDTPAELAEAMGRILRVLERVFTSEARLRVIVGEADSENLPADLLALEPLAVEAWLFPGENEEDRLPRLWVADFQLDAPLLQTFEAALRGSFASCLLLEPHGPGGSDLVGLYEGGIDTFVGSGPLRRRLRQELRAWRSPRRDGL